MRPRTAVENLPSAQMFTRMFVLMPLLFLFLVCSSACTFFAERPPKAMSEATGGEGLERVFWKEIQAANSGEIGRSLASNYSGVTPNGTLDRAATLDQYRQWQLKDYSLGDLKTELNGNTLVVTYTITLNGTINGATTGTAGSASGSGTSQPLPSQPQHMMTVWQQQKKGWIAIAHSVSQ